RRYILFLTALVYSIKGDVPCQGLFRLFFILSCSFCISFKILNKINEFTEKDKNPLFVIFKLFDII
ncbi:MAG: hypothetical protein ACTH9R_10045, partial [Lactococcus cremoris]